MAFMGFRNHVRKLRQLVGSYNEIDMGKSSPQVFALLLGHATAHAHDSAALIFHRQCPSNIAQRLLIGLFAYRAGIEENDIGRLRCERGHIAMLREEARDAAGVVLVHLAPERPDEVGFMRRCGRYHCAAL